MNKGIFGDLRKSAEETIPFSGRDPFETAEEFITRLKRAVKQPLCLGRARLVKEGYNIETLEFPINVQWEKWFQQLNLNLGELYIIAERDIARKLYETNVEYPVYVKLAIGKGKITAKFSDAEIGIEDVQLSGMNKIFPVYQTADKKAWEEAQRINTVQSYQNYLNGKTLKRYEDEAQRIIYELESADEQAWKNATQENIYQFYRNYLNGNTIKKYAKEAQGRIYKFELADEEEWRKFEYHQQLKGFIQWQCICGYLINTDKNSSPYEWHNCNECQFTFQPYDKIIYQFCLNYLNGNTIKRHAKEAQTLIHQLESEDEQAWQQAIASGNYGRYFLTYTIQRHADEARKRMNGNGCGIIVIDLIIVAIIIIFVLFLAL